jgi:hypothetical protein
MRSYSWTSTYYASKPVTSSIDATFSLLDSFVIVYAPSIKYNLQETKEWRKRG